MSETPFFLSTAPIVEAVIDIDCDLPPGLDVEALDAAGKAAFGNHYPRAQRRMLQAHQVIVLPGQAPTISSQQGWQANQYLTEDGKQLVQVRPNGYSFNRLAPYTNLDDYLPEIERTWQIFVGIAQPIVCRMVRMRYINRIALPMEGGRVDLDRFLESSPRPVDEQRLQLTGFFEQQTLIEAATGHQAIVVRTAQPVNAEQLPVILDITVTATGDVEPGDWTAISGKIAQLRDLKNLIFRKGLTEQCLQLFHP